MDTRIASVRRALEALTLAVDTLREEVEELEAAHERGPQGPAAGGRQVPPEQIEERRLSGLDAKIVHYAIVAPNEGSQGGVTRSYQTFADALRDHTVPWTGRGTFTWARNTRGQRFESRRLAEDFYRREAGLRSTNEIPHWG